MGLDVVGSELAGVDAGPDVDAVGGVDAGPDVDAVGGVDAGPDVDAVEEDVAGDASSSPHDASAIAARAARTGMERLVFMPLSLMNER